MKCLLFGSLHDAPYHPLGPVADELKKLSHDIDFAVTDDPADLVSPRGIDAVLNYADWLGRPFPDSAVDGLMRFVESGRGLVTVHNGIILNNRKFNAWTGAVFSGHPEYQELRFIMDRKDHPVTAGLADYGHADEMYRFEFSGFEKLEVLVTCELKDERAPSVWTMPYGRGRTVSLAAGHTAETFRHPVFRELLRRSLFWVGR